MLKTIRCTVNGKARELSFDVRASLLEVLRAEGLTSSKQGCGVGECGACTVLVDNIPVDSCIFLAVWADGKTIRTAEGEAKGNRLSRVQQAYVDAGAVQCGFCTPGLVMSSTAFIEKHKGQPVTREGTPGTSAAARATTPLSPPWKAASTTRRRKIPVPVSASRAAHATIIKAEQNQPCFSADLPCP